ncbi:MAG: ribosomal protein S18-alanine N-acetyltransferase [Oscillospiraceae bacterium]|jgi:ribosomal-protein-alanine N-acetyltransferase
MTARIVPMEQIHVPLAAALEAACFSVPWSEKQLAGDLERDTTAYFAALDEQGAVVGYAGFYTVLDEASITNVAVHPGCRRQGIGQALLRALLEEARARKMACLTLEVRESNVPAIRLYMAQGFEVAGRRRRYYEKPPEDAILMTIPLES